LWANIHAKRERGESPAKPGDKEYPKIQMLLMTMKKMKMSLMMKKWMRLVIT
jgi:hypothetical protein